MQDLRTGGYRFASLPARVDRMGQKGGLARDEGFTSVDRRVNAFETSVDRRFDEVSEAIAEQRRYSEFAFERLDKKVTAIDTKLDEVLRILRR